MVAWILLVNDSRERLHELSRKLRRIFTDHRGPWPRFPPETGPESSSPAAAVASRHGFTNRFVVRSSTATSPPTLTSASRPSPSPKEPATARSSVLCGGWRSTGVSLLSAATATGSALGAR